MTMGDMTLEHFLHLRGVESPCNKCRGLGTIAYANTATWRGGMGGNMITHDVCCYCWGSGDEHSHGVDLRKLRSEEGKRVRERAAQLFADRCGIAFRSLHPGIRELCDELERFGRGRKKRAYGFDITCLTLGKLLRELCDASEPKPDGQA